MRGGADLDLLELRQHLFGEADHRLLIVWGREACNQVAVADLQVRSEVLHDLVDGADRLVLPNGVDAVGAELCRVNAQGLGGIVANHHVANAHGAFDRFWIAANRLTVLEQHLFFVCDLLRRAAHVVRVAVLSNELQRDLLTTTADQDRQVLLNGGGKVAHRLRLVARAGCGWFGAVEHAAHDRERLAEPAQSLWEAITKVQAEVLVLLFEPGGTNAKDGAAVGDVVEGGGELRRNGWLTEGVRTHHQADANLGGVLSPRDERRPAFEHGAVRVADDWVHVVPGPEGVKAHAIGGHAHRLDRLPVGELRPHQRANLDLTHDEPSFALCGRPPRCAKGTPWRASRVECAGCKSEPLVQPASLRCTVAKETVDGAAQPKKKKMSKKRKFLIAVGVIAGLLVGAWVLVVTPAINKLATEQLQAAGLEGAIVEIRADGAKLTLPTLPASVGGGDLMASNLVFEFGGFGIDDINGLMAGAESGTIVLPEGTHFTMTADTFSSFSNLSVVGTEKTAALTGTISNELAQALAAAIKDGKIEGSDATAGLPMSDIVLTPGSNGTVMTATVDVAAMLALLAK